jgi:hypothetical protein
MMSGVGYGTGPGQTLWFCHCCQWAGFLPVGYGHRCKGTKP